MQIRLSTLDDLPAIVAISNWAAAHTAANFAAEPESVTHWRTVWVDTHETHPWFTAIDGAGRLVGFARSSPWKGRCAYDWSAEVTVYVHHEHHGKGVGTALYRRLFATLREQGFRTVLAGITLPNPASVRLHESMGMRQTATFHKIGWKFDAWHDVGYWEVRLEASDAAPGAVQSVAAVTSTRRR